MRPRVVTDPVTGTVHRRKMEAHRDRCRCGKQAYSSKKLAKATAVQQSKTSGDEIEAYHCFAGHCYHIGHKPGTERSGQRQPREYRRRSNPQRQAG